MLKKSTVLIIGSYPPPYGGIAVYTKNLLNSPVKEHFDLLLLRTASRSAGEKQKPLIKKLTREIRDLLSLSYTLLKDRNIKIVQVNSSSYLGFWRYTMYILIAKSFQRKIILRLSGGGFKDFYENCGKLGKWYIEYILALSDKIIVLTHRWKSFFSTLTDPNQIVVVPNAVYYQDFDSNFNKAEVLAEHGLSKDEIVCTFLGGMLRDKGVLEILEVIEDILSRETDKNIYFVFAGEGPLVNRIKDYCRRFKQNVTYLGCVDKERKIKLLNLSNILLLPSYAEGFPNALLEAMAVGLPVITTHVGGIPDIIKDGENGFLIQPRDVDALKEKILMLVNNKELREEMGRKNRELVKEKYSWDKIAEKIREVYDEVLKRDEKVI